MAEPMPIFPRRVHLALLAAVCTVAAAYGSFVPLQYQAISLGTALERFGEIRLLSLSVYRRADLVANFLLFVPLGFLWLGAVDSDRRSRWLGVAAAVPLAVILAALAVGIEFAQLWFPRRTVSLNDLFAESAGGVAGIVLWFLIGRRCVAAVRGLAGPGDGGEAHPAVRLLKLYALGLVVYAIQPLDLTFTASELGRKFADGKVNLIPFAYDYGGLFETLWGMGVDVLLFVPIGVLYRLGRADRSWSGAVALTFLMAAGIETLQVFVFSRFADGTDVLMATLGGGIGAMAAPRWRRTGAGDGGREGFRPGVRIVVAMVLTMGYAIPLGAALLHPFVLERDGEVVANQLRYMFDWPFRKHYYGSEFSTLSNVLRGVMLFLPLGAMWRWGCGAELSRSWAARVMVFVLVVLIGFAIELSQAFMAGQYADSTDLMIYPFGAWLGWIAWGLMERNAGKNTGHEAGGNIGDERV